MPERPAVKLPIRSLASAGLLIVLAGCGWFTNRPPVEADEFYEISAAQAVAAGQVVLAHGVGAEVVSVKALQPHMSVSAATHGTSTVVAWVGGSARTGRQVQVGFSYNGTSHAPELANARAYADAAGADLGSSLEVEPREGNAPEQTPLTVAGLDHPPGAAGELQAAFADYRLGDVDANGAVNALDALKIRYLADAVSGTPHELYHSDLDGDYDTDSDDVQLALDKAVNPDLPARLIVKPPRLDFVQLDPNAEGPGLVLVANGGNQPLAGLAWSETVLSVSEVAGITGQAAAWQLGAPPSKGWRPESMSVTTSGGGEASVKLGNLVILVAGQSNASGRGAPLTGWPETPNEHVRMLGNDYRWKAAQEPLDSALNQVDAISEDSDGNGDDSTGYSFGTYLGNLAYESLGFDSYLIPSALGGSAMNAWLPIGATNRSSLFGSANFRALVSAGREENPVSNPQPAAGGPVNVIVWHQGESENLAVERASFLSNTNAMLNAFDFQLGAHVLYAQIGSHYHQGSPTSEQLNVKYHAIAELQRQMEGTREDFNMVVTYDLPRSDRHHLSAYGQRIFAERLALALREHVFGEPVDGTGPRLVSLSYSGPVITITVDMPLTPGALDKDYFTVWDGAPTGSLDDIAGSYKDGMRPIQSVVVPSGAPETIVITMVTATTTTPYVRLMVPHGVLPGNNTPSHSELWQLLHEGVPRSAASALPLPVFGPLAAN